MLRVLWWWLIGVEHLEVNVNEGFTIIDGTSIYFSGAPCPRQWKHCWLFRKVIKGLPTITIDGKSYGMVEIYSIGSKVVDVGNWNEFHREIDEWLTKLIRENCGHKDLAMMMVKVYGSQMRYESIVCRGVGVVLLDCKTPDDY